MRVAMRLLLALLVCAGLGLTTTACGSSHGSGSGNNGGGGGGGGGGGTPNPLTVSSPATLTSGTVGTAYSFQLEASGGTTPYNWSNVSSMPPGLTLFAGGGITGTPTQAGSFTFQANVTDSGAPSKQVVLTTFTLDIAQ